MAEIDKRLRYYNGQFLQDQDFTDEQQYHLDRQRRHNRLLHSYGIADGLAVTAEIGESSVTVHPGTAIDKYGRTIVLTELRNVSFEEPDSKQLLVVIAYGEEPSDPARVGDPGNTRWLERPEVKVVPEADSLAEDLHIRLALLHLDEDGTVGQHDKTVRRSAGKLGAGTLEVQAPLGDVAQFIQDQNGKESALAIGTGKAGVGTDDLNCVFTIAGDTSLGPTVEVRSTGNDASIRYAKNDESGIWHAGVGPLNNFYFWNQKTGASALFTPEGALSAHGIKISGEGITADSPDPMVEVRSEGDDASIRYTNKNSEGVWHAGVGPLNNFYFWNQKTGASALFTPEGVLTAQGIELSSVGVAADVKGDLSVTGKVLVSGTVDGRDVSADGTTLDTLASSTIEGIRLGGNINLAGQAGITVTGDAAAKAITIANNAGSLVVPDRIDDDAKAVQDQLGTPSALRISRNTVEISADVERHVVFKVTGKATNGPIAELHGTSNESSIRYAATEDGVPWHVGTGGWGGAKNFFFWNQTNGIVVTIMPDGSIVPRGTMYVGGGVKDKIAFTAESDNSGPTVEVRNKQEEAIIRYMDKNNVPWHVGTGGAGGAKNFFFWNQTNGVVTTITPDGSTTTRGTLNAGGGTKDKIVLTVEGDRSTAPILEVRNKQDEASIRYINLEDNLAWHSGTGGGGGEKNFFFWNEANGIVWTIEPSGAPTMKGIPSRSTALDPNRLKALLIDPNTGKIYRGD